MRNNYCSIESLTKSRIRVQLINFDKMLRSMQSEYSGLKYEQIVNLITFRIRVPVVNLCRLLGIFFKIDNFSIFNKMTKQL